MKYELVYIIDPRVEEEARKELIARFAGMLETNGGSIEKTDEWGKRHLAYPINDQTEGYYVLVTFTADSAVPKEMERNLGIAEEILRYLVIRVDEKRSSVKPRAQRAVAAPAATATFAADQEEAETEAAQPQEDE